MKVVYTFIISFFKSKKCTQVVKNKIDAPRENQCSTRWLLNGFLSHGMLKSAFIIENAFPCRIAELIFIAYSLVVRKIHIMPKKLVPCVFHVDHVFSTTPRVFHQTPCFPPDPVFSTRPRIFHQTPCFPPSPFSLEATKFCLALRLTPAVPTQTVFRLRINTFLVGKILLLFHQKTALLLHVDFLSR